jgi:RimJ/RimL family protein N-acetyltransferase
MRLETKRLILRPWKKADIGDLIDGLNNLGVSRWLAFVPHPYTAKAAGSWIKRCVANDRKRNDRHSYEFAIELKADGKVIGGVSLDRISKVHGTAGGGIWLNEKFQGQGYGTEAFGERIRFAFEELKLRRLENGFIRGNPSSLKMQLRFGYKIEGVKRAAYRCAADGKLKDECITGLLRAEWVKRASPKQSYPSP